jgi:DNA-binding MarR family transcriptional regulator
MQLELQVKIGMNIETIRNFREKLRQLEREIGWQLKSDTECCGITLAQCHIILEIGNNGETSVVDLANALGLDTSTLSRHINGMVNVGLVDRVLNPKDRRYVSITLTDQGRKVYRSADAGSRSFGNIKSCKEVLRFSCLI